MSEWKTRGISLFRLHERGTSDGTRPVVPRNPAVRVHLAVCGRALAMAKDVAGEDASVKGHAVHALSKRGGPDTLGSLRQVLSNPDPSVKVMVIDSIIPEVRGLALLQDTLTELFILSRSPTQPLPY